MTSRTGGDLLQDFLGTYDVPFVLGNPGTTETTFLAAYFSDQRHSRLSSSAQLPDYSNGNGDRYQNSRSHR